MTNNGKTFRELASIEKRISDANLVIDPGFVNARLIETVVGPRVMEMVDQQVRAWHDFPDWMKPIRLGHAYTRMLLSFCKSNDIPTLATLLSRGKGTMFCSVEMLAPCPEIYEAERTVSCVETPGFSDIAVELHYSTAHISSDTIKANLHKGGHIAVIAILHEFTEGRLVFYPLIMGAPWLESNSDILAPEEAIWHGYDFFENFIEDFDEFSRVRDIQDPKDFRIMQSISETALKDCLAELLGDKAKKDWGGETSDHFSAHIHLGGRRLTAAFLLKGPSDFRPMTLNHLGKNNDQIYRLSQEPAEMLVVQHCHEILPPVRATLRVFAVQPGNPRRYCLIDGRDSLRLLEAYAMVDWALELSRK